MMEVVVTIGAIRRAESSSHIVTTNMGGHHQHSNTNTQLLTGQLSFLSPTVSEH